MTNWFKGIDEGLSTPGGDSGCFSQVISLSISVNGDDSTGDGSPNPTLGKLSIFAFENTCLMGQGL